jgi:hypothetical protein
MGSSAIVVGDCSRVGRKGVARNGMPLQPKASPVFRDGVLYLTQQTFGDERGAGGGFPLAKLLEMMDQNKDGLLTRDD